MTKDDGEFITVTIPKKEWDELIDSRNKLMCLEAGGVDNWDWYYESLREGGYYDEED